MKVSVCVIAKIYFKLYCNQLWCTTSVSTIFGKVFTYKQNINS